MDADVLLKIFAGLAAIVSVWFGFSSIKRKQNANPAIASADERERYDWRYARWGIRTVQFLLGIYLLWMIISFILT